VLVTGAAGQIGYSIVPMIACGDFLGPDQPIILHLLDIPPMMDKLKAVEMELHDCAFPLLKGREKKNLPPVNGCICAKYFFQSGIVATTDVKTAFEKVDYAFLVGAFPRKDGMERKDLLARNAAIFKVLLVIEYWWRTICSRSLNKGTRCCSERIRKQRCQGVGCW